MNIVPCGLGSRKTFVVYLDSPQSVVETHGRNDRDFSLQLHVDSHFITVDIKNAGGCSGS